METVKRYLNLRKAGDKLLAFIVDNKAVCILIVLCVVSQFTSGGLFFTKNNLLSVLRQSAVTCLMACGYCVLLAGGNVDLSVGYMLSLLNVVYGYLAVYTPIPTPLIMLLTLATGALCGYINGFMCMRFNLVPFILTLATAQVYRGICYVISGGISVSGFSQTILYIGSGTIAGVPVCVLLVVLMTAVTAVLVYRTRFGRHVLATGGNMEAAYVSGVNTKRIKILTFVYMGLCNAIAAMVLVGRVGIAHPSGGDGMETNAICSAVIGGTVLGGGKANVLGAVFGGVMMSVISNLMNLAGVNAFWQWVVKGLIIIFAILADSMSEKFYNRVTK